MQGVKPFTIGFVTDPSLSRERTQIALRSLHTLRNVADIRYYPGNAGESELLERVRREALDLLLLPWHLYLQFQKIEAHFGLTRTYGPTVVGYFAEDLSTAEIQEEDHHFRAILLDLNRLQTEEVSRILRSLLRDSTRWGLRPQLLPSTPLHFESWSAQVGLGFRIDTVLGLPEIASGPWSKRGNSIRILISALWSLIFDHGPGKVDQQRSSLSRTPRAYFEVGADSQGLGLRLCYSEPGWKVKDVLHQFWPGAMSPSHAGQVLHQYSDFLRVHVDPETNELEVVSFLYPSAPAEQGGDVLRTLWIEPLSRLTRLERSLEDAETQEPHHRPLITHHQLIGNAAEKIDELKKALAEKEERIETLESRRNVTEQIFVYPNGLDGEQLLDLMNRRIAESKLRIKSLQAQIAGLRKDHPSDVNESTRLIREIRELAAQQKSWISRISALIGQHEESEPTVKSIVPENSAPPTPEDEIEAALAVAGTQVRTPKTRKSTRRPMKRPV